MRRLLPLIGLILTAASLPLAADTPAFPFTYFIHDTTGVSPDTPLSSIYQLPSTPVASNSHIVLKGVNITQEAALFLIAQVTAGANSTDVNTNFSVTGSPQNTVVPAGGSFFLTVNLSPTVTGPITGFLQTSFSVSSAGCDLTKPSAQCSSGIFNSATFTATATEPELTLSYQTQSGSVTLAPNASAPEVDFGHILLTSSSVITFTLSNLSNVSVSVPKPNVEAPIYFSSPFTVNVGSNFPNSLAPSSSVNFTVTFAPGTADFFTPSLVIGDLSYPIKGEGVAVMNGIATIAALSLTCITVPEAYNCTPQGQDIEFSQVVAGGESAIFSFKIENPSSSPNAVTVPSVQVTGSAFTLNISSGTTFPLSLAIGASFTFTITYTSTTAGNNTGELLIGTRQYSLNGSAISPPLPSFSIVVNPTPLASQQQANVTVQLAAASTLNLTGTISLAFAPSISNVTDDPAIVFLPNNGRKLPIKIAAGSQTATYDDGSANGQSAIPFQTGTTAGAITFKVSDFANTPDLTQTYTITPSIVQITSASAARSNPNLVVTLAGYDNSYSAGRLTFTFYDTSGNVIAPVTADASGSFQQLFFTSNTAGGAFSLTATFPVTGDVTKVGSVAISMNNAVGQANSTQVFQ